MRIVEPIMGVAHWRPDTRSRRGDHVTFEAAWPVAINGGASSPRAWSSSSSATASAAATASA
jgi:hypothetical protein